MTRSARLALRLAACALAGTVITVAVAWGTGVRPYPKEDGARRRFTFEQGGRWFVCFEQRWWAITDLYIQEVTFIARRETAVRIRDQSRGVEELHIGRAARDARLPRGCNTTWDWQVGLPFRSMWSGEDSTAGGSCNEIHGWPGTWRLRASARFARFAPEPGNHAPTTGVAHVPYGVLPLGFALDTLFYGTLVFLLWSTPAIIRRRIRKCRGHCPACGYDLRGSPGGVCPECGGSRR